MNENVKVTKLVTAAFAQASLGQRQIHERWIRVSTQLGNMLPQSSLLVSVQSLGNLDTVIRMMEDETSQLKEPDPFAEAIAWNHKRLLSEMWVSSAYEIIRMLYDRDLVPETDDFNDLLFDLELLRMPLVKYEVTKVRKLIVPMVIRPVLVTPDNTDSIYADYESHKAHILPAGTSGRGSNMWLIADEVSNTEEWVERRNLSDQFLSVFES